MNVRIIVFVLVMVMASIFVVPRNSNSPNDILENTEELVQASENPNISKQTKISIQPIAYGLKEPKFGTWSSSIRFFISEKGAAVRVWESGVLRDEIFYKPENALENSYSQIILGPSYGDDRLVYVSEVYEENKKLLGRVSLRRDLGSSLEKANEEGEDYIIENIPVSPEFPFLYMGISHDQKLYIAAGETGNKWEAQDTESLAGKILRFELSGEIPEDNPVAESPVWSIGHRPVQGFDWMSSSKKMYATEVGAAIFEGPVSGDEINKIEKLGNYGWPFVSHDKEHEGTVPSLKNYVPAIGPSSLASYEGSVFDSWKNSLLVSMLEGQGFLRITLDENGEEVLYEEMLAPEVGRIGDIFMDNAGYVYVATSNTGGKSTSRPSDDAIYRVTPQAQEEL